MMTFTVFTFTISDSYTYCSIASYVLLGVGWLVTFYILAISRNIRAGRTSSLGLPVEFVHGCGREILCLLRQGHRG